jgi:integrase
MNPENSFAVSRFKNRNGAFSWRVDGRLNGVRIRRNFKTQEEAAAEKSTLETKALRMMSSLSAVVTCLTEDQVREAEVVFRRLVEQNRSLSFYVDFALNNYKAPTHQKLLPEAMAEYVAAKAREHQQGQLSIAQLERIRRDLNRLEKHFPGALVGEVTSKRLAEFFNLGNPSFKTYNNRRGIVSTFLNFGFRKEWITENPILKVPNHRIRRRRGTAATLSALQAQELMSHVEAFQDGRLVPFFALCLFAGIRPCLKSGEIYRLKPEHVRLDEGVIAIEAAVSKVGEARKVTIQPNLAAWLRAYPLNQFPIVVPNLQRLRARIAKKFYLSHDIMRHTFLSMFISKFRSIGEAALQAGNSESIIRKHYLDLKDVAEAKRFFDIRPCRQTIGTIVAMPVLRKSVPRLPVAI